MTLYTETVMDHFTHPRNVGEIPDADGVGEVGNAKCGDIMKMYLKIKNNIIEDVKFETFGCGSAIASSSIATEMIKGRTLEDALVGLPAKPHGRAEHDEHAARDERERTTAATGLFSRLFARLFFRFFVGRAFSLCFGPSLILSLILIPGQGGRRHRACVLLCGLLRFGCGGFGVLLLFLRHDGKSWVECSGPSGGLCLRRMKCGTF